MLGVLAGFFVVWAIILVGMFVGRQKILGENARQVLSALTFFVASPALLFETLSKAKLHDVFAAPLLVTAVARHRHRRDSSSVIVKFLLKRTVPESLMSSMSASLANSANLGIPIAVYVLGRRQLRGAAADLPAGVLHAAVPDGPGCHHQLAPHHARCASSS